MNKPGKKITAISLSALAACASYLVFKNVFQSYFAQHDLTSIAASHTNHPLKKEATASRLAHAAEGKEKKDEAYALVSDPSVPSLPPVLSPADKKQFDEDLLEVFTHLVPARLQKDLLRPYLQKLNARGLAGIEAIIDDLAKAPASEQKTLLRMAQVDYLKYRMGWDPSVIAKIEGFLQAPLAESLPTRIKAIILADKAELVGGLARIDWERAQDLIAQIDDPLLRDLSLYEAFHGLQGGGATKDQALALVQTMDRNFIP